MKRKPDWKMTRLYVENMCYEGLFGLVTASIIASGGDGGAAIICKNHEKAAELYLSWWLNAYQRFKWCTKDYFIVYSGKSHTTLQNGEESIVFTSAKNMWLSNQECIFVLKNDCKPYIKYIGNKVTTPDSDRVEAV